MLPIKLGIRNIDKKNMTCLVESLRKVFPVTISLPKEKLEKLTINDSAIVVKSNVTGEWLMIDYHREDDAL